MEMIQQYAADYQAELLLLITAIAGWLYKEKIKTLFVKNRDPEEILKYVHETSEANDLSDFQAIQRIHQRGLRNGCPQLVDLATKCLAHFNDTSPAE